MDRTRCKLLFTKYKTYKNRKKFIYIAMLSWFPDTSQITSCAPHLKMTGDATGYCYVKMLTHLCYPVIRIKCVVFGGVFLLKEFWSVGRDVVQGSTSSISAVHVSITPNQFAYYLHWILSVAGKFSREISNLNSASHAVINRIFPAPPPPTLSLISTLVRAFFARDDRSIAASRRWEPRDKRKNRRRGDASPRRGR